VLAVDVGTQSARAALVDRAGHVTDSASSPIQLFTPAPGWAEQAPEDWWAAAVRSMSEVLRRNPDAAVAAVGVGAQMHGVVPVDAGGRALAARVGIWNDKRAAAQAANVAARPDAAALVAIAGNVPLPAWAGFKIAWMRDHAPDVHRRAATYLVVKDLVNLRLTGVRATDPSEASGTWLLDARSGRWSDDLLGALGLAREHLPDVIGPGEVIGGVTAEAAAVTGLAAGTPVVCGAGDMLCQLLAAGNTRPGRACEVSGTASVMAAWGDRPAADPRVMNLRAAGAGWARFGIADAGGVSLRWFGDRLGGGSTLEELTRQAADVPAGAGGLLFLPSLLGERTMGSSAARGAFVGLTPGHGRPELLRAILEGVAFELRRALEVVAERPDALRVTGGGAASAVWNEVRAGVYGLPVRPLAVQEGGVRGAAILAGVGAGWWDDPAAAAERLACLGEEVRPDPERRSRYERLYAEFRALHDLLDARWPAWPA
jgi:sugar (pentulose or hexulose) kinase